MKIVYALGLGALLASGCGSDSNDQTGTVVLSMAPGTSPRLSMATEPCTNIGTTCLTPTELSLRIGSVYLAYDVGTNGSNVETTEQAESTQAVYGNPGCELQVDSDGVIHGPNFASCSLDLGGTSSAGPTVTSQPEYIDLAKSAAEVKASLDAGKFAVAVGTYRYLRMDIGTNVPGAAGNGTQDSLPSGTAMNVRFNAAGMAAPYEVRRLIGSDVHFTSPLVVAEGDEIEIALTYTTTGVVYSLPSANPAHDFCTAVQVDKRYCTDPAAINIAASIKVNGVAVQ